MTKTAVDTFTPEDLDSSMEWLEFVQNVRALHTEYLRGGEQRNGQALMNACARVRPDLYNYATGAIWDPFYKDENILTFWHKVYDQFVLTLGE